MLHLLFSHLVSILGFALGAVMVAYVVVQRRAPGTTYAWLLAIVLIPYVGVPLYLFFGGRKLKRRAIKRPLYEAPGERGDSSISSMMCASGAPPVRHGNQIEFHLTGEVAFRSVIDTLNAATKSIRISTLILAKDEVGSAVLDVLEAKARAGVEVRLLLDAMFKLHADRHRLNSLRSAGVQFAWFMPVWHISLRAHANLRLHRKIIVVDGKVAIVGGMNLALEYMGPTPTKTRWRDLGVRIIGRAVDDIDAVFRADWAFAASEQLAPAVAAAETTTGCDIQVVGSGPDVANDLLYDAFLSAVFEARRRIWISTPSFVPDEALVRGLVLAARRGVDVRVVVPAHSNHRTADLAGASYLREVADAGGKICCYQPGMLHAKAILADDSFTAVGSANLDMRSLFLDFEIALFFTSTTEIATVAAWFETLWPVCGELPAAGRAREIVEAVARLIGPLE